MDIKITFLNGELDEQIYMQQPTGFVVLGRENKVRKLQRLIYILKQSLRHRNLYFHKVIISYGFIMIPKSHFSYRKRSRSFL